MLNWHILQIINTFVFNTVEIMIACKTSYIKYLIPIKTLNLFLKELYIELISKLILLIYQKLYESWLNSDLLISKSASLLVRKTIERMRL